MNGRCERSTKASVFLNLRLLWQKHGGAAAETPVMSLLQPTELVGCLYGSEEIDQRDLLFQQVGRLERIARKAETSGQFSAPWAR